MIQRDPCDGGSIAAGMTAAKVDRCERHNQLLMVYQMSADALAFSVDALKATIALSTNTADYEDMREYIEEARELSEQARTKLEAHVYEHGCHG